MRLLGLELGDTLDCKLGSLDGVPEGSFVSILDGIFEVKLDGISDGTEVGNIDGCVVLREGSCDGS